MKVTDSVGSADLGSGIYSTHTVQDCVGTSTSSYGIYATTVNGSSGTSTSGTGVIGLVVSYSFGSSTSGTAINGIRSAIGCSVGTGAVTSPNKLLGTP